jgi:Zn finger protein HypA/HybF involved in hydrogenase expression
MASDGSQKRSEQADLAAEIESVKEKLSILRGKLARSEDEYLALCHKRDMKVVERRYASRRLGIDRVSARCEECGKRFKTKTKAARFCLACKKKRRTSWFQLQRGSHHGGK